MDAVDLAFAGAVRQAEMIRSREISARELTELYLDRIARLDPQLNAYRVVFAERALAEAGQADGRARAGDTRPLLGVPFAIKDDLDVAGEVTAWGSDAHDGPVAADAEVVRRLRTTSAVILGKTHVPELAITPIPAAWTDDGFPVGAQLVVPRDGEPVLMSLAAQLERSLRWPDRRAAMAS